MFAIVHSKRTIVLNIVRYSRVDNVYARTVVRLCRDEKETAVAAAAAAEAIDQSTSNGRRAGSVPADSLCVCSRPPLSIFLRFRRRRRRMYESVVHTTTAETAYSDRFNSVVVLSNFYT